MSCLSLILILAFSFIAQAGTYNQELYLKKVQEAEIVVVAKVVEVKGSPGFWSGVVPAVQRVRYVVKGVLKGNIKKGEIDVGHYIVKNSRTADAEQPHLSYKLFKKDNEVILLLKPETLPKRGEAMEYESRDLSEDGTPTYFSSNENYGAILGEPKLLEVIYKSLRTLN